MAHIERKLSSKPVFEGKIVNVYHDTVELENGNQAFREVIRHPGAVAVLALDGDEILLVRQYRYCIGQELLEIPAGKLEPGEEPLSAAARELSEETGSTCGELIPLGKYYGSAGCMDEGIHLYFGRISCKGCSHPDEDEFLRIRRISIHDATEMILRGEIPDGKTQLGILRAKLWWEQNHG